MASHHTGGDAAFRTKLVARPEADDVGAVSSLSIPRTRQHALSARNAKRRHSSDALGGAACRKSAKRESNIFQLFVGRASHVRLKLTLSFAPSSIVLYKFTGRPRWRAWGYSCTCTHTLHAVSVPSEGFPSAPGPQDGPEPQQADKCNQRPYSIARSKAVFMRLTAPHTPRRPRQPTSARARFPASPDPRHRQNNRAR